MNIKEYMEKSKNERAKLGKTAAQLMVGGFALIGIGSILSIIFAILIITWPLLVFTIPMALLGILLVMVSVVLTVAGGIYQGIKLRKAMGK